MLYSLILHPTILRVATVLCLSCSVFTLGCSSKGPQVKVLGVTQPKEPMAQQRILVFVEVINPTRHDLRLSRLEYNFHADSWLDSEGKVGLAREIAPGASAVVEIPVPVRARDGALPAGVPFTLEGTLFAQDDRFERSWVVHAKGNLRNTGATGSLTVRVASTH